MIDAKPVKTETRFANKYEATFKVDEIVAQPVRGEPFKLAAGESITIRIHTGYGGEVEDDAKSALAPGIHYYLVLLRTANGTFEHARGASAMRTAPNDRAAQNQHYVKIRSLAAVPEQGRLMAWIDALKQPTEPERFRAEIMRAIADNFYQERGAPFTDEARKSLLEFWNAPRTELSIALRQQLDFYILQKTDPTFADSEARRDVWLSHLLTLTPESGKHGSRTDYSTHSVLGDLGQRHPQVTGKKLVQELSDRKWPEGYRREIAIGLWTAFDNAEQVEPKWQSALDAYFLALLRAGEPLPARWAASVLAPAFNTKSRRSGPSVRRSYQPDAEVIAALKTCIKQFVAAAKQPGADEQYGVAAQELNELLESPKTSSEPEVAPWQAAE